MDNFEKSLDNIDNEISASNGVKSDNPESCESANSLPEKKKVRDAQNAILSYLHDLVFLLAALLLLFVMIFRIVVVSGDSMLPTLHEGDYLVVLSSSIYKNPKPGDIVVISKNAYDNGKPLVKRVIAVGGQTVNIENNVLYVDGKVVDEGTEPYAEVDFPIVVPEGKLFVLGDNRGNSKDSRSSEIGLVDEREVLGKVLIIALPANDTNGRRNFKRFGAV